MGKSDRLLELLGSLPEPPGLLLTDVVMPGMDGRVLAQQVIRRQAGIPVVFMSGYAEVAVGAPGLLRKIHSALGRAGKRD